ncbi:DUF86 domain-containing protein [Candidatus Poriferisodalis sp.]|uniref:HepT-like ribonuclease domain-containing protein n=1 Tax=Candidatus Poriferisodalis sp. TaxID=3101277 RepID=UPI003B016CBE
MYSCAQPEDWLPHIRHMLEAAEKVIKYVGDLSEVEFYSSDVTYDATKFEIIIIAEAAGRLTDGARDQFPEVPWHQIRGMRNRVVHEYDRVSEESFWDTVTISVPQLVTILRHVLAEHEEQ